MPGISTQYKDLDMKFNRSPVVECSSIVNRSPVVERSRDDHLLISAASIATTSSGLPPMPLPMARRRQ